MPFKEFAGDFSTVPCESFQIEASTTTKHGEGSREALVLAQSKLSSLQTRTKRAQKKNNEIYSLEYSGVLNVSGKVCNF